MDLSVANLVRQAFKDLHTQHHNHLAIPQQASVEPHMALNSLALEPQLAWQATLEVLPAFAQTRFTPPENWPAWIECLPPTGWLLHALGEFPQRLAMDSVLEGDTASPTLADTPPSPASAPPSSGSKATIRPPKNSGYPANPRPVPSTTVPLPAA